LEAVKAPPWTRKRDAKERPFVLISVEDSLRTRGLADLLVAVGLGALMLVAFDWRGWDIFYGTAIGIVVWGAFYGLMDISDRIPSTESLTLAPADATTERVWGPRLLLLLPLSVAVAWYADRFDLGAVFVPGQWAGSAVARLAGLVLVRRWQQEHETEVLLHWGESGEPELYAA
jgi:hypothetical protein